MPPEAFTADRATQDADLAAKAEPAPLEHTAADNPELTRQVKQLGADMGFAQLGITDTSVEGRGAQLDHWLAQGYQGDMAFIERHRELRLHPERLHPGTTRIICVALPYLPEAVSTLSTLEDTDKAYIARYSLGRDYHKTLRKRLAHFARRIEALSGPFNWRPFVDSAPVLEKPLAQRAGLGWQGKHSLIINRRQGSHFVLGELFTDLPLVCDPPQTRDHCGQCRACIDICPTGAIVEPYVLDARRCISYLTIESRDAIPEALRPLVGNRIFGCDDCQLICPWNRYNRFTEETDFNPRQGLDRAQLVELFRWDEATFLERTQGSALRRTGHEGWLRNLAVALGNSRGGETVVQALHQRSQHPSALVREHVHWALERLHSHPAPRPAPLVAKGRKLRHLL